MVYQRLIEFVSKYYIYDETLRKLSWCLSLTWLSTQNPPILSLPKPLGTDFANIIRNVVQIFTLAGGG